MTTGAQLHPLNSVEITRIADGQNLFHSVAMLLVKQMECSEHWCEQNDDTTISIIALACAYVISIDFNGLCEEEDKSSYHWARHLDWWYTALLRFGNANPVTLLMQQFHLDALKFSVAFATQTASICTAQQQGY